MTDGDGATVHVEYLRIDLADRSLLPAPLPGRDVGRDLAGERLVHVDEIEVAELQSCFAQHPGHGDAGCHQQTVIGVDGGEFDGADESQRLVSEVVGCPLTHQQNRRRPVGQW